MKLNELAAQVHAAAKAKGFYDKPKTPLEYHMLIVSEVAEASEQVREGNPPVFHYEGETKPEGEAVELADALIRILDYMAYNEWDVEAIVKRKLEYNSTRPYMHGKKL